VAIATALAPEPLLAHLSAVEAAFGRIRTVRNAARVLDLDLLLYGGRIARFSSGLVIPPPPLPPRPLVPQTLAGPYPGWCHPVFGRTVQELLQHLDDQHVVTAIDDDARPDCARPAPCAVT
jgi:2-amino-4-hydroxy-6-hydroxymethyldihydropteridine diphosphokinase